MVYGYNIPGTESTRGLFLLVMCCYCRVASVAEDNAPASRRTGNVIPITYGRRRNRFSISQRSNRREEEGVFDGNWGCSLSPTTGRHATRSSCVFSVSLWKEWISYDHYPHLDYFLSIVLIQHSSLHSLRLRSPIPMAFPGQFSFRSFLCEIFI